MKKATLTLAIMVFCFTVFYSFRQISRFRLQSASAEDQIAALDAFYKHQEEIILKNAQNELEMLEKDYLFKLGCLDHIHNITRQERQARRNEINREYKLITNWMNSKINFELQVLKIQVQEEKEKLYSSR